MGTKAEKKKMVNNKKKTNNEKREGKEPATSAQAKSTATVSSVNHEGKVIKDPRFSSVHSDPRFQRVPKHQSKVAIDSRFNRMFSDKNFSSSSVSLDKRGKPRNRKSENPLRHYYRLGEEEEEETKTKDVGSRNDEDDESEEIDNKKLQKLASSLSSSESSSESEPSNLVEESQSETSSTGSDTDDEDGVDSDEEDGEPEENIPVIEQETRRLAIVNMDWSQIRAVDLYVLMSSFLPKDGHILSVSVYPSEIGLKCMEEEAVHGPIGLFDSGKDRGSDDDDDDNDDEIDNEKLRAYEKRRLRYYYAVLECDSSATADYLYKSCDGTEFERTSNVLDLRFIPDSMEFKHPPRDVATEAPTTYEGVDFQTRALQHSKIHLTWEEDEPQRAKILRQKFNADQLAELELNEFLASDDGESIDDDNDEYMGGQSAKGVEKVEKYRALLQGGVGSDEDGEDGDKDMEVTFNTGLEDISKRILEKNKDKKSETVWEAYLRKRREKKKERKNRSKNSSEDESSDTDKEESEQPDDFFIEEPVARSGKAGKGICKEKQQGTDAEQEVTRAELELLLADDQGAEQSLKGYNLKPKKAKGKKGKEDIPSEAKIPDVEYDDPRFSALFKSSLFALDPTDPQYKRSAAYARRLAQKQQKGAGEETRNGGQLKPPKQAHLPPVDTASKKDKKLQSDSMPSDKSKYELSSLVRSVKKKAQQAHVQTHDRPLKKHVPLQSDGVSLKREEHGLSSLAQSVKKRAKILKS